jgi:hypothetical protein
LVTIAYAADEVQAALDEDATLPALEVRELLDKVDTLPTVSRIRAATKPVNYEL